MYSIHITFELGDDSYRKPLVIQCFLLFWWVQQFWWWSEEWVVWGNVSRNKITWGTLLKCSLKLRPGLPYFWFQDPGDARVANHRSVSSERKGGAWMCSTCGRNGPDAQPPHLLLLDSPGVLESLARWTMWLESSPWTKGGSNGLLIIQCPMIFLLLSLCLSVGCM